MRGTCIKILKFCLRLQSRNWRWRQQVGVYKTTRQSIPNDCIFVPRRFEREIYKMGDMKW